MSDPYTSSDEEFESADEGEEELSSNSSSSALQTNPVLESLNQLAVDREEKNEVDTNKTEKEIPSLSAETTVSQEETGWEVWQDEDIDEVMESDVKESSVESDTPLEIKDTEETKEDQSKQTVGTSALDYQNAARPDDAETRSVGQVPSRGKPSLGAKKLGAVKVAKASTTLADSEQTYKKTVDESAPYISPSFSKVLKLFFFYIQTI